MFVSDYHRVNVIIDRINEFLPDGIVLADIDRKGNESVIDAAARTILATNTASSVEDVIDGNADFIYLPDGESAVAVKRDHPDLYVVRNFHGVNGFAYLDASLVDLRRSVRDDDLTMLDVVDIIWMLRTSQVADYVLFRYDDVPMQSNVLRREQGIGDDYWTMCDGFMTECRSTVANVRTNEIVSLPYHKFRNLSECDTYSYENVSARIADCEHAEFTEKLDGSMIQMRYIGDVSAFPKRGGVEAGVLLSSSGSLNVSTSDHVRYACEMVAKKPECRYNDLIKAHDDYTFIFELLDSENDPHVVKYDSDMDGLWLTGARCVHDGTVMFHDELARLGKHYGIPVAHHYDSYCLSDVVELTQRAQTHEHEGFVLNVDGFLVKLKLKSYLEIRNVMQIASSFNYIIRKVYANEMDDVIANVPDNLRGEVQGIVDEIRDTDARIAVVVDRFAAAVPDVPRREQVAWMRKNLPSDAFGYVMNALNGRRPSSYVVARLETKSPSYPNRVGFDKLVKMADAFERAADELGC